MNDNVISFQQRKNRRMSGQSGQRRTIDEKWGKANTCCRKCGAQVVVNPSQAYSCDECGHAQRIEVRFDAIDCR